MNENDECFVKKENGEFDVITYKELKKRRKENLQYYTKKFIPVNQKLIEVSEDGYKDFYRDVERYKYIKKEEERFLFLSIDSIPVDNDKELDIRESNLLEDQNVNIGEEIERQIEIEMLKRALLELNIEDYKMIKALFFDDKTLREYAEEIDIPFTTLEYRKLKILQKLKEILKNFRTNL